MPSAKPRLLTQYPLAFHIALQQAVDLPATLVIVPRTLYQTSHSHQLRLRTFLAVARASLRYSGLFERWSIRTYTTTSDEVGLKALVRPKLGLLEAALDPKQNVAK